MQNPSYLLGLLHAADADDFNCTQSLQLTVTKLINFFQPLHPPAVLCSSSLYKSLHFVLCLKIQKTLPVPWKCEKRLNYVHGTNILHKHFTRLNLFVSAEHIERLSVRATYTAERFLTYLSLLSQFGLNLRLIRRFSVYRTGSFSRKVEGLYYLVVQSDVERRGRKLLDSHVPFYI